MKTKLFYKIFAFTFGMMLLITVLAHVLIFMIAPSENVLITSTTVTNEDVLAFSEVDMPQLITQTILKSFPLSFACCMVISLVFSFLFSKGITGPILSISTSVHQMSYYFQIQLHHLLAPFPFWRPLIPLSVALLRCVSFTLARMKNSRRILVHFYLEIVSKLDRTAEITVISTDEIGGLANDINSLYQSLLVTIRNLEEEKDKVQLVEKEKIDFLRTASHELKTPVTELNATLENMILKIGEYSDYESYLPRCKEITEQLAEMIKDILNASRLQMQMEDVPVTTFSLAECVSELCEPYRLIAETNGLRFQIEIIEDMSVRLPENQLKKALSNILSNAVNYTEAERHIKVKLEKSVLSIQNECVPLSPDELQHIFEPFYRPNRARNPANGGNGLGLYIVKTILDKQGLQYCFTSMKSKTGMEFVIYF